MRLELRYNPIYWLRDDQIIPEGAWRYCFCRPGRGWGKTKLGAAWIKMIVDENPDKKGFAAIVGATHKDVHQTMVAAIADEFSPHERPIYNEQKGEVRFHNGAVIHTYASDTEARGGNYAYVWCDEMVKWNESIPAKIEDSFSTLDFACRKGDSKFLITTTPKPFPIFKRWQKMALEGDPLVIMMRGSMQDNTELSSQAKSALMAQFGGTRRGREELEGEILSDNPGALWTYEMFAEHRVEKAPNLSRVIISVDPAVSTNKNSDKTGIVVCGLGVDGHIYVLEDASGTYSPNQWAKKVAALFHKYRADRIVAEKNNGGQLVESNIRTVLSHAPITLVHASKGKMARAEPVAALYEQGRVHHTKFFQELEDQCCSYTGNPKEDSPDALDSLVWGCHELLLNKRYVTRNFDWVPQF